MSTMVLQDKKALPFPRKSWYYQLEHWQVPGLKTDVDVYADASGLILKGETNFPSGGEYTMGRQSLDEFLSHGPKVETPPEICEKIREYISIHRPSC